MKVATLFYLLIVNVFLLPSPKKEERGESIEVPNWSNQKKFLLSSKIIATIISLHCLWFVYKHRKYPGIGLQLAHLCRNPGALLMLEKLPEKTTNP